jgi:hypothetical protein
VWEGGGPTREGGGRLEARRAGEGVGDGGAGRMGGVEPPGSSTRGVKPEPGGAVRRGLKVAVRVQVKVKGGEQRSRARRATRLRGLQRGVSGGGRGDGRKEREVGKSGDKREISASGGSAVYATPEGFRGLRNSRARLRDFANLFVCFGITLGKVMAP